MPLIAPVLVKMTSATVKVAANNYETSASRIQLTPSVTVSQWKGVGGNTIATSGIPEWVAEISYLQDWATTNSLSKYLLEHAGEQVVMDFYPKSTGPGYRATVTLVPGPIGGDVDAELVGTVSLSISGQPAVIVP